MTQPSDQPADPWTTTPPGEGAVPPAPPAAPWQAPGGPPGPPAYPPYGAPPGYPPPAQPYGQPYPPYGYPAQPYGYGGPVVTGGPFPELDKAARTSRVLGILSICLFWIPFVYLVTAVPMGIVAIVKGKRVKRAAEQGAPVDRHAAQVGFVTGIVGLSLCGASGLIGLMIAVSGNG